MSIWHLLNIIMILQNILVPYSGYASTIYSANSL